MQSTISENNIENLDSNAKFWDKPRGNKSGRATNVNDKHCHKLLHRLHWHPSSVDVDDNK